MNRGKGYVIKQYPFLIILQQTTKLPKFYSTFNTSLNADLNVSLGSAPIAI